MFLCIQDYWGNAMTKRRRLFGNRVHERLTCYVSHRLSWSLFALLGDVLLKERVDVITHQRTQNCLLIHGNGLLANFITLPFTSPLFSFLFLPLIFLLYFYMFFHVTSTTLSMTQFNFVSWKTPSLYHFFFFFSRRICWRVSHVRSFWAWLTSWNFHA